jgi:hypothetical protein
VGRRWEPGEGPSPNQATARGSNPIPLPNNAASPKGWRLSHVHASGRFAPALQRSGISPSQTIARLPCSGSRAFHTLAEGCMSPKGKPEVRRCYVPILISSRRGELALRRDRKGLSCSRGDTLKAAGPPAALLKALEGALDRALEGSRLRVGREQKEDRPDDRRAVVQFHMGIELFDWFSLREPDIARTSEGTISAAYGSRVRSSKVYAFASMISSGHNLW